MLENLQKFYRHHSKTGHAYDILYKKWLTPLVPYIYLLLYLRFKVHS